MPFNFSWLVPGHLAGTGKPGCGLEYAPEMLPHEHRLLTWLNTSRTLRAPRSDMPERLGLSRGDQRMAERRLIETYRKFKEVWPILTGVREGFGEGGVPVDHFIRNEQAVLDDLKTIEQQGIRNLVTLTERPIEPAHLEAAGMTALHIPVEDQKAPTQDQLSMFVRHVDDCLAEGKPVAVHCLAGIGRTGTCLAAYLVHCGASADAAIKEVRLKRPSSIENEEQEQAVHQFEGRRNP